MLAGARSGWPLARSGPAGRRARPPTGCSPQVRAALADDLDAPPALAAVDAWAGASLAIDGDDAEGPALVARTADALLGVAL